MKDSPRSSERTCIYTVGTPYIHRHDNIMAYTTGEVLKTCRGTKCINVGEFPCQILRLFDHL